jgi:hypothetical protein
MMKKTAHMMFPGHDNVGADDLTGGFNETITFDANSNAYYGPLYVGTPL